MTDEILLNGAYVGQLAREISGNLGPFRFQTIHDDGLEVLQSTKQRLSFVIHSERIVSIQDGTDLLLPDGRAIQLKTSIDDVLRILGEPSSYHRGNYHTHEFDNFDRELEHPDSPGVTRMQFLVNGHEIRVECFDGPRVSSISLRRAASENFV